MRPFKDATDVAAAAELIMMAFEGLPAHAYLVPDAVRRFRVLRGWFHMLAEHAAAGTGQLTIAGNCDAVAVWFDRTGDVTQPPHYVSRLKDLADEFLPNFIQHDTMLAAARPRLPHLHLAFLAVHPQQQSTGLGGALLDHAHHTLDEQGHLAYLERTGRRREAGDRQPRPGGLDNHELFGRHGYVPLNDPQAVILPNGAAFYRVMRQPKAPS